ncbi:hypothetical protein Tco_0092379 [Tanacetum coccineum]
MQKKEEENRIAEEQAAKERFFEVSPFVMMMNDNDYPLQITPCFLSTEEPVNSLIMENEHLDTISATESDEFIKSSVENLVPIPKPSSGQSHYHSELSLPDFKAFALITTHFKEKCSGRVPTTHVDFFNMIRFIFDLSNDQFPLPIGVISLMRVRRMDLSHHISRSMIVSAFIIEPEIGQSYNGCGGKFFQNANQESSCALCFPIPLS